jgi:hypothetical protein
MAPGMSTGTSPIAAGAATGQHLTVPMGERLRKSAPWWLLPTTVVTVLTAFSVYAIWTAVIGHNEWGSYLSPFYSPQVLTGRRISPAFFVLWMPLSFRATCYYYRKAYFRSYFLDPPSCARSEPREHRRYAGETRLFVLNNLHRYTLYLAILVLGFLWYDAVKAFFQPGTTKLQLGLGTGIMLLNVVLLSAYTFGCHAFRHLVGGRIDCYSCVRGGAVRHRAWKGVSALNVRHPTWAWASMFSVVAVDVYIHMLSAGWFVDPHISF